MQRKLFGKQGYYLYKFNCNKVADIKDANVSVDNICNSFGGGSFESRETVKAQIDNFLKGCLIVGLSVTCLIGIIGIVNLINLMCTSIVKRKKEFAMMECVGFNRSKLKTVVGLEGIYYVLISAVFAMTLGSIITIIIMKLAEKILWFYQFKIHFPASLCIIAIMLILAAVVPIISFHFMEKRESLLERLR